MTNERLTDDEIDKIYESQYEEYGQLCDRLDMRMFARSAIEAFVNKLADRASWPEPDAVAEVYVGPTTIRGIEGRVSTYIDAWSESLVRQILKATVTSSSVDRTDQTPPAHQARP